MLTTCLESLEEMCGGLGKVSWDMFARFLGQRWEVLWEVCRMFLDGITDAQNTNNSFNIHVLPLPLPPIPKGPSMRKGD